MKKSIVLIVVLLLLSAIVEAQSSYTCKYKIVLESFPAGKSQEAISALSLFTHPINIVTGTNPYIIEVETLGEINPSKLTGKMEKATFSIHEIKLLNKVMITEEQRAKLEELLRKREEERIAAGK